MTAEIHIFNGITSLDIPVDRVLEQAIGKLQGVVVLGYDEEGEFYGASNYADRGEVLWLLELCKKKLMEEA